jgi:TPR repeat protein
VGDVKQRIKTFLAGGVLALALFGVAAAGQFEDGLAAYQRHDYAAALRYWRVAADHGEAAAQLNLGIMYEYGQGVRRDYAQAVVWYRKAAEQGFDVAQNNLGAMYYSGLGVPQDYEQAATWSRKAAEQGNAGAQGRLGLMYDDGQGVLQDYVQAYMWYNLAGASGLRARVAAKMTPAQIAEAQQMAREWQPTK